MSYKPSFIFDMDGVLVDTNQLHTLAWIKAFKEFNVDIPPKDGHLLKGLPTRDCANLLIKLRGRKVNFSEESIKYLMHFKRKEYDELLKNKLDKSYILPGILDFLEQMKNNNIKAVVASSSGTGKYVLKKVGLEKYFKGIVDPKKIRNGKPSPDIFLEACKILNVKPSETIGFEDAESGIKGLHQAGIDSVAITWEEPGDYSFAKLTLKSTVELNLAKVLEIKN